ncbi:MAG: alpha/beta hydrolase [Ferruginibacter sp.]
MEKVLHFRGSVIYYTLIGKGTPVVLLHGFGEDRSIWDSVITEIKEKFCLIIPDLPGSGRSQLLTGDLISINDYADCIRSILEVEDISPVIMIGHSLGGYLALAYAEMYPGSLISLGLFHSGAYPDDDEKKEIRKKAIAFIREKGSTAFLKTSIPGLFMDPDKNKNEIEILFQKGAGLTNEALIQYYEAMIARPDRTFILKSTNLPVLFIIGEHDKAIPFAHSLEQTQLPAHSYVYILRNSAHMGMLEENEKCRKILADFLHDVQS